MCNLKEEPWRENFTGRKCACGVPMPGTPEELEIDKKFKEEKKRKRLEEHKREIKYKRFMIFGG